MITYPSLATHTARHASWPGCTRSKCLYRFLSSSLRQIPHYFAMPSFRLKAEPSGSWWESIFNFFYLNYNVGFTFWIWPSVGGVQWTPCDLSQIRLVSSCCQIRMGRVPVCVNVPSCDLVFLGVRSWPPAIRLEIIIIFNEEFWSDAGSLSDSPQLQPY